MMRLSFSTAAVAVLLPLALLPAQTIQSYTGAVFIPGGGEEHTVWTKVHSPGWSPVQAYDAAVQLILAHVPQVIPTTLGASSQITALRTYLDTLSAGNMLLVAHSMGGLVARETYRQNPSRIAGLLTIATPHLGSYTANNRAKFTSYLNATISRLAQTGIPLGALYGTGISPVIGTAIGGIAGFFGGQKLQQFRDSVDRYIGLNPAAAGDVVVGSGLTTSLSTYTGDANLPRGSVHGNIPVTNFPIRLLSSVLDSPSSPAASIYGTLVTSRNVLVGALRTCKIAYYVTIVLSPAGRRCSLAKKMLVRMDGQFFAWATGQTAGHTLPRAFDGIVEAARGQYPGLTVTSRKRQADESDHLSIMWNTQGVGATAQVMREIGMLPR